MDKINILVLGVGGNVSQGIIKALKNTRLNINLIGACVSHESLGLYFCDKAYIAPYADSENFIDWLIELCNKENIDIVLTGVEENICAIMKEYKKFSLSTKAVFKATEYDKLMIGQDKYLTCEWLKENKCNYPQYCLLEDKDGVKNLLKKIGFPLIAKPRRGKSSQGVIKINSMEELALIENYRDYILEECVGEASDEYTVGTYCDKNGRLISTIIMHRKLVDGSTAWAKIVDNIDILNEAERICKAFRPIGPLNIQLRLSSDGKPTCFELNVRFSGTTPMRAQFGYNDVEAMVREYVLNENIDNLFNIKYGEAYRYVNELYIFNDGTKYMEADKHIENMSIYKPYIDTMGI